MILKTVAKYHYQPRPIDEDFPQIVFDNFIKKLDPYNLILSQEDIANLEVFKKSIGEEIQQENSNFLIHACELYTRKLLISDSTFSSVKNQELDYSKNDTLIISSDNKKLTNSQLLLQWKKFIKYQVLENYYANIDSIELNLELDLIKLNNLKTNAINRQRCRIKTKLDPDGSASKFVSSCYLKAIASSFDPHTNYFSAAEKEEFISSLSKEKYSFGFEVLRNDLGEIVISKIIPGSPAWKSNSLNEGDIIRDVKVDKETTSFECISTSEVVKFLSSESVNKADFRIRKNSKTEVQVSLEKDKINVEENVIRSYILHGKNKIGYIYLPSFYTQNNYNDFSHNGCANDIAKELLKLKREGIKALILDLRNNGGGSMEEAIKAAGIFIDWGTLSIVHYRDEEPRNIKDINRGVLFTAPLSVLINGYSASASELFASAMQDHNRALIIGSKSFGKSTAQMILPIDIYKYSDLSKANFNSEAHLKLTNGAFYRVTGKSHQKEGVSPDITLPEKWPGLQYRESFYSSAIDLKNVTKETYYSPLPELPIEILKRKSMERVSADSAFGIIKKLNLEDKRELYEISIPLNYQDFKKYYSDIDNISIPIKSSNTFKVSNPSYIETFSSDFKHKENEKSILQIKEDVYIGETFNILTDLLAL